MSKIIEGLAFRLDKIRQGLKTDAKPTRIPILTENGEDLGFRLVTNKSFLSRLSRQKLTGVVNVRNAESDPLRGWLGFAQIATARAQFALLSTQRRAIHGLMRTTVRLESDAIQGAGESLKLRAPEMHSLPPIPGLSALARGIGRRYAGSVANQLSSGYDAVITLDKDGQLIEEPLLVNPKP